MPFLSPVPSSLSVGKRSFLKYQLPPANGTRSTQRVRQCWSTGPSIAESSSTDTAHDLKLKLADCINLCVRSYAIASQQVDVVQPSPDDVINWYLDQGQDEADPYWAVRLPYWAVVWASAVAVGAFLSQNDIIAVHGKRVASIGCGLGLDAVSCGLTGAAEVDLFDQEPRALQCALLTACKAGLSTSTSAAAFSTNPAEAAQLVELEAQLKTHNPRVPCTATAYTFDWNQTFTGQPYDVVVACDVLYDASAAKPLAQLLPEMLSREDSRIVLTDPIKRTPKHREDFLARVAESHPDMVVETSKKIDVDSNGVKDTVLIMVLRRRAAGETIGLSPTNFAATLS